MNTRQTPTDFDITKAIVLNLDFLAATLLHRKDGMPESKASMAAWLEGPIKGQARISDWMERTGKEPRQ